MFKGTINNSLVVNEKQIKPKHQTQVPFPYLENNNLKIIKQYFPHMVSCYQTQPTDPNILHITISCGEFITQQDKLTNWIGNREPSRARIPEIITYIGEHNKYIITELWISVNKRTNSLDIIDGIHRTEALKEIYNFINNKELNYDYDDVNLAFLKTVNFNFVLNTNLKLNILFNKTEGELRDIRNEINSSEKMAEFYKHDSNSDELNKIKMIEEITKIWVKAYPKTFVGSTISELTRITNCQTTETLFKELLDKLYDRYNINCSNIQKLNNILEKTNDKCKNTCINYPVKKSGKKPIKIQKALNSNGCYLFIYSNAELLDERKNIFPPYNCN